MSTAVVIIIVVAVVVVLALAGAALYITTQRRRSKDLQESFGGEYDRAVDETGSRRQAESELAARRKRVDALNIQELSREDRKRFEGSWRDTQAQFVDDPKKAIGASDRLVAEVMQKRGYPVGDFEQRAADISVDHAGVVEHYRAAHSIALAEARGRASTEDLRQAMIHYRALFQDLLGGDGMARRAG